MRSDRPAVGARFDHQSNNQSRNENVPQPVVEETANMEPAKRQRVNAPDASSHAPSGEAEEKSVHNGPCCFGVKVAGTGPGYKLTDVAQIGLAKRTKACWMNGEKRLVATKCGKCKKIIVPTAEQLDRMARFKLISVYDEVQLREFEAAGFTPEEALALAKEK